MNKTVSYLEILANNLGKKYAGLAWKEASQENREHPGKWSMVPAVEAFEEFWMEIPGSKGNSRLELMFAHAYRETLREYFLETLAA